MTDAVAHESDDPGGGARDAGVDAQAGAAGPALTARLDAWRARNPARADPLGAAFIEQLARRAQAQPGAVRHLLQARLNALLTAHEARLDRPQAASAASAISTPLSTAGAAQAPGARTLAAAGACAVAAAPAARPPSAARTALAALVDQLARQSAPPLIADRPSATDEALASLGGPPDLKAMGYFRSTWSRLSAERRLTQSLARVPDKAGPLNAQHLVHQTLAVMRELSPGYLNHFLDHADTLMWLERVQSARPDEAAAPRNAGGAGSGSKGSKAPARKVIVKRNRAR